MIYHPDDFHALSDQVSQEGGRLLADPCKGHELRYRLRMAKGKYKWHHTYTTNCGYDALMEIPYDPKLKIRLVDDDEDDVVIIDQKGENLPKGFVKVCAVDDAVGLWPRYSGIITKRSYQS